MIYTLLLWASYQLGEFSQVYPVARGTAPLVVAVIEVVLGHVLPALQLVGIVVISLGLISLALDGGRLSRAALPALGAAVSHGDLHRRVHRHRRRRRPRDPGAGLRGLDVPAPGTGDAADRPAAAWTPA